MKKNLLSLLISFFSYFTLANDLRLGDPQYGGSGCPNGSMRAVVSPEGQSLSIILDKFVAEAGGKSNKSSEKKLCNIILPVHIPKGYSVAFFQVDYRGFNSLPNESYSNFEVQYSFSGTKGQTYQKRFDGQLEEPYFISNSISEPIWSPCGKSVVLKADPTIEVHTNAKKEQALSTIDTVDLTGGLIFNIQWKRCQ